MPDVLLYGDTSRSPALRHEIPIAIIDPFLYAEVDGQAYVMTSSLEHARMAAVRPDATLLDIDDLGFYELLDSGLDREALSLELVGRAAARSGVREAIVDFEFPLGVAERLRAVCVERGAPAPVDAIVASVWQGFGHDPGSGPLPAGLPIEIDVWPQDEASQCWADMTRTFVVAGEPPQAVRRQERLVDEALRAVRAAARPGVLGRELHALTCDVFEREGYRTYRTGPGEDPAEGFQFSLGHGVGLQVHEDPGLGMTSRAPLVAGDVVAVEPGLWDPEVGGVRFEDLLLVTEDGCETLTDYPYDLAP